MKLHKFAVAAAVFIWAFAAAAAFREIIWNRFTPPKTIGSSVASAANNPDKIGRQWFYEYFDQLKGWTVPYDYRIISARIDNTEVLTDLNEPYVQIDYTVYVASANEQIIQNLELAGTDTRRKYIGQMVLCFEKDRDGLYTLKDKIRPVQYQIMTPDLQQEIRKPQTEHYKIHTDSPMTYYIEDQVLYVTYDSGKTLIEVPDGYERVCSTGNGYYNELLNDNSYIVSEEFTGFIADNDLIYSLDKGNTWKESRITDSQNIGNKFLSLTKNGYYVTIAVDRSLGTDYYASFFSDDLVRWTKIKSPDTGWTNLECSFWSDSDIGYYASGGNLFVTTDRGNTWQQAVIPEAFEITSDIGFNPFDTVEKMYEEDGNIYLFLGQGDDGDYMKDGRLAVALYRSEDGIHFTFIKETSDNTPDAAG